MIGHCCRCCIGISVNGCVENCEVTFIRDTLAFLVADHLNPAVAQPAYQSIIDGIENWVVERRKQDAMKRNVRLDESFSVADGIAVVCQCLFERLKLTDIHDFGRVTRDGCFQKCARLEQAFKALFLFEQMAHDPVKFPKDIGHGWVRDNGASP